MGHATVQKNAAALNPAPLQAPETTPLASLACRLANFSAVEAGDKLRSLVGGQRGYDRDTPAWAERGDLSNIVVIESGWAYKFTIMHDGRRHIADFFGPGAICNWSRLSRFEEQDDILFKSGTSVALLDPVLLDQKLADDAGLASTIKRHELARVMRTTQRIRAFISLPAIERTLLLLLDFADELRTVGKVPDWICTPFAQAELADMLGLTPVHVSRVFKKLVESDIIERDGNSVRFTDRRRIERDLAYSRFFQARRSP